MGRQSMTWGWAWWALTNLLLMNLALDIVSPESLLMMKRLSVCWLNGEGFEAEIGLGCVCGIVYEVGAGL